VLILFGDKIRSQTKPFLYLFQLVGAKDPVHDTWLALIGWALSSLYFGNKYFSEAGIQIISATLMDEWREVANC
jgi:hypothetical protein